MHVKSNKNELPYQLPQPRYMRPDLILEKALTDYLKDDELWVPSTSESVSFKPLLLHVSSGYYVNLLRVKKSGFLSRHRHSGDVQAFVLKGKWYYLEHDWIAEEGSFAYEPPGETHTLFVPDNIKEMITLFTVKGGYTYVDEYGEACGYEDVFTKIEATKKHYDNIGLDIEELNKIIR